MTDSTKNEEDSLTAFRNLVKSRRSVRRFTGRSIPEAVTRDCLELATLAANSSNLQPWHFYWVKDPEKKTLLAKACLGQNAAKTAAELIVITARTDTWKEHARWVLDNFPALETPKLVTDYYSKQVYLAYNPGFLGIKGIIKVCLAFVIGLKKPMPRGPFTIQGMRRWAVKSTALAASQLMLAYRAHGFDTCPLEGIDAKRVAKIIGLGRRSEIIMVMAAGERAERGIYHERFRLPMDRVVSEV
jgi:nitroreductase